MTYLQLTAVARARIWSDIGETSFDQVGELRELYAPNPTAGPPSFGRVILEAYVPRGAYVDYGLLGIEFVGGGDAGQVVVPYSSVNGRSLPDSLASAIDDVSVGLPVAYANVVCQAILAGVPFPAGVFRVCAAAHGRIGSSPAFFRRLTVAAVELMREGGHDSNSNAACLRRILV